MAEIALREAVARGLREALDADDRVFLMGENRWLGLDDWPPPEATGQDWHLTSQGRANTGGGDGCLTRELPGRQGADRYTSDPADPVPSRGGPL